MRSGSRWELWWEGSNFQLFRRVPQLSAGAVEPGARSARSRTVGPVSDAWDGFSWGPDKRAKPGGSAVIEALMAVVIAVLLVVGVVGVFIDRTSSHAPSANPAGFQRLQDEPDQISLAVPALWEAVGITSATVLIQLTTLEHADPNLAPLVAVALQTLQKSQVGVFAVDGAGPTAVFTYGVATPTIHAVGDVAVSSFVNPLKSAGAQDVQAAAVHMPLGQGEQLSFRQAGTAIVSEYLDYFLYRGRLVFLVVMMRGDQLPTTLLHQIAATLAPA